MNIENMRWKIIIYELKKNEIDNIRAFYNYHSHIFHDIYFFNNSFYIINQRAVFIIIV
jgi:hypothetical protein